LNSFDYKISLFFAEKSIDLHYKINKKQEVAIEARSPRENEAQKSVYCPLPNLQIKML